MDIGNVLLSRNVPVNGLQTASRTGKNDFLSQVQQARMAPQTQDTVSLSGRSYEDRLSELRTLHKNTDYSGMSGKEIDRLIRSRFEDAFENYGAIAGGLYLCAGLDSIYEQIRTEKDLQLTEALNGEKPWDDDPAGIIEYRRYAFGYEGLSEDEIMDMLHKKYSGGTYADRYGMAWEMMNLGLGDHRAAGDMLEQIRNEMVKGTERQYGYLYRDNPLRVNAMISYAENNTISWTQLVKNCYEDRRDNWTYQSEELKQQILQELKGNLEQFLDRLGLPQIDLK